MDIDPTLDDEAALCRFADLPTKQRIYEVHRILRGVFYLQLLLEHEDTPAILQQIAGGDELRIRFEVGPLAHDARLIGASKVPVRAGWLDREKPQTKLFLNLLAQGFSAALDDNEPDPQRRAQIIMAMDSQPVRATQRINATSETLLLHVGRMWSWQGLHAFPREDWIRLAAPIH